MRLKDQAEQQEDDGGGAGGSDRMMIMDAGENTCQSDHDDRHDE